ncbi:bucentaur or craniofacial development-domain-containing protein [Cryomyces antarcticus]
MADIAPPLLEEDYDSAADDDFDPTTAEAPASDASSSDEDDDEGAAKPIKSIKKRKARDDEVDFDSGDEVTIQESRRKKRRKDDDDDDIGGEGGMVRTRAQRRVEQQAKKEYATANNEGVTIDVDALWQSMSSVPLRPVMVQSAAAAETPEQGLHASDHNVSAIAAAAPTNGIDVTVVDEMITIKRTYDFAGQTHTEEKRVPRNSAEARLYLSIQSKDQDDLVGDSGPSDSTTTKKPPLRRPLRRVSQFEPNPAGEVRGLPAEKQRINWKAKNQLAEQKMAAQKAQKLTAVQKSALDWAQHVDREGLQEELDKAGRAKGSYLIQREFLNQVELRREEAAREARQQQ